MHLKRVLTFGGIEIFQKRSDTHMVPNVTYEKVCAIFIFIFLSSFVSVYAPFSQVKVFLC